MFVKSARTVSREFSLGNRVHIGVAEALCCAKFVYMLFTISL